MNGVTPFMSFTKTCAFSGVAALCAVALTLPSAASAKRADPTDDKAAQVKKGKELYGKNCVVCHGANGVGDDGPSLRGLTLSDNAIIYRIQHGAGKEMPAFKDKLKDPEIKSIVAYLRTLKK